MIQTDFEVLRMKFVGAVKDKACQHAKRKAKIDQFFQDGRLPVGVTIWLQEAFLCVLTFYMCLVNFIFLRDSGRRGLIFELFKGALLSHIATPIQNDHIEF